MDAHPLKLKVRSYVAETPFIRSLVFGVEDGVVPRWQAGAHVRAHAGVQVDRRAELVDHREPCDRVQVEQEREAVAEPEAVSDPGAEQQRPLGDDVARGSWRRGLEDREHRRR